MPVNKLVESCIPEEIIIALSINMQRRDIMWRVGKDTESVEKPTQERAHCFRSSPKETIRYNIEIIVTARRMQYTLHSIQDICGILASKYSHIGHV